MKTEDAVKDSNFETEKEKLLQIVLVGQPELARLLQRDDLVQLKQRIALRQHIPPLAWEEVGDYIQHRLEVAGAGGRIHWADDALLLVHRYSRGVPRLIKVLCDKTLLAGYVTESFSIEAEHVQRAIGDLEGAELAAGVS